MTMTLVFQSIVKYRHQPHGSKMRLLERGFHTLIKNISLPSLTDVGSHNPLPYGSASSLAHHSCLAL